ncbi:MAG: 1-deoxy-D-xylulose-5-phosphate reductoisomerase [Thermodesulfobacteriota bacterium]|nr:MAG: 1-deoxy-D-xylulose-5-phosphate reductoisomerase [Thermodesulfobacteriota bacterium]
MSAERSPKKISILGSTGSIGRSTLDIVRSHPDRFEVVALAAGTNTDLLREQIEEFKPGYVSVLTEDGAKRISRELGIEVGAGVEGAVRTATCEEADMVVSAISGAAGLVPTVAAVKAGKDIALANKETLVMAGPLIMDDVKKNGVRLMPVDSEHSAIFQALAGHNSRDVKRIILTASGGPFLNMPAERLAEVTPEEALNHPRWSMGRKITIDSATLMNKGLEVIEAHWLFGVDADRISVCIHPQSIVHSMVEYKDGSIVAQLGSTDMKGPISYALSYPERIEPGAEPLGLDGLKLEFFEPEAGKFPCLALAYRALEKGGTAPTVLNAADEVAVEMFLNGAIGFTDIFKVIEEVFNGSEIRGADSIEDLLKADRRARRTAVEAARAFA